MIKVHSRLKDKNIYSLIQNDIPGVEIIPKHTKQQGKIERQVSIGRNDFVLGSKSNIEDKLF